MMLFSLYELMDAEKRYQKACMEIINWRAHALITGLGPDASAKLTLQLLKYFKELTVERLII